MRVAGVEGDIPRERSYAATLPSFIYAAVNCRTPVPPHTARVDRETSARLRRQRYACVAWGGHGAGRKHCARTRMLEATKQNTHTPSWLDATAGEGLRLGQKKKKTSLKGGQGCVIRLHLSSVRVKQVTSCRYAAGDDVTGQDDVSTPLLLLFLKTMNRLQDDGESLG